MACMNNAASNHLYMLSGELMNTVLQERQLGVLLQNCGIPITLQQNFDSYNLKLVQTLYAKGITIPNKSVTASVLQMPATISGSPRPSVLLTNWLQVQRGLHNPTQI